MEGAPQVSLLGIDIGSYKSVLTNFGNQGIDIILSDSSSPQTPSLLAFTTSNRMVGQQAMNQKNKNFKNTI